MLDALDLSMQRLGKASKKPAHKLMQKESFSNFSI